MSASLSVIVTTRNECTATLARTVEGIRCTCPPGVEVVLVDDGSDIPVQPIVGTKHVRHVKPLGVAGARRAGADIASGEALCWLDAHMTFDELWSQHMLEHLDTRSLICAAFWSYERDVWHCIGADYEWCSVRDYEQGKSPGFHLRHRTTPSDSAFVEVPMIIGACYMMHRDAYEAIGGWSPYLRIWGVDEQEMSMRCRLAGLRVGCVTTAKVGHLSRNSFPYPVQFEHLEFNQLVLLDSILERSTRESLMRAFEPIPEVVAGWLATTDLVEWRNRIQTTRTMSDSELFDALALDPHMIG